MLDFHATKYRNGFEVLETMDEHTKFGVNTEQPLVLRVLPRNAFEFLREWIAPSIRFIRIRSALLALCLGGLLWFHFVGSDEPPLEIQLQELRQELSSLQALRGEVARLSAELATQRASLKPPDSDDPLSTATLRVSGNEADDPFIGPKDAETIVMVFSDFQCKNCRKFFEDSFGPLAAEFAEKQRLKLIFRDFPLLANAQARAAAAFAHCSGEQGEYWQAFSLLNANPTLVDGGSFEKLGLQLERVNQEKLTRCLESKRYEREILGDVADAQSIGIKGAPSTFIGRRDAANTAITGVLIRGAQPYQLIKHELEKKLIER